MTNKLKDVFEAVCKGAVEDGDGKNIPETYLKKTGDSKDNTASFTSADSLTPAAWADVPVLATGEKHSSILNKISTMFRNIRWLYKMLGTTDIASIGGGTLTGAISKLNTDLVVAKAWKTSAVSFMACTGETSGITVESFLDRVVSEAVASNTAHGDSFQSIVGAVEGPIFCALTVIHSTKKYYGGFAFTYSSRYQAAQFFCEGGLYGIRFP